MENFKGMKKGTSKTLKVATAAFVLTSGVAVSSSVVGPDVAQAKLGEQAEVYHPSDNPAEESITISADNTQDNPARATGALSGYWIGYYITYEDGETQYVFENEEDGKFFALSEGTQTVNLIHDYGDEQGYFDVTASVSSENIDDEPTVESPDEEAPVEDSTDDSTDEAPVEDSTDESTEEAPADDTTDESTDEAPADDSTDDSTEEAPADDSMNDSTGEEAPADNVSDENAGSDSEQSEEANETASASEGDNDSETEEITSSEDVEKLPRTGGDAAPLSAVGGLMVLLSSAVLAFRKKFSKQ